MAHCLHGCILFFLVIAGCNGPYFRDSAGTRVSLSGYDHISVRQVEVTSGIARPGLSEDLTTRIRDRLNDRESRTSATGATKVRQIDLQTTVVKASYPSRSKIIWLGSAHKITCRLQVHDHETGNLLGSAKVSASVEPLMGNAALLNFGALGILGRTAFDRRKHDADSLCDHMAREIVEALDRAKRRHL